MEHWESRNLYCYTGLSILGPVLFRISKMIYTQNVSPSSSDSVAKSGAQPPVKGTIVHEASPDPAGASRLSERKMMIEQNSINRDRLPSLVFVFGISFRGDISRCGCEAVQNHAKSLRAGSTALIIAAATTYELLQFKQHHHLETNHRIEPVYDLEIVSRWQIHNPE